MGTATKFFELRASASRRTLSAMVRAVAAIFMASTSPCCRHIDLSRQRRRALRSRALTTALATARRNSGPICPATRATSPLPRRTRRSRPRAPASASTFALQCEPRNLPPAGTRRQVARQCFVAQLSCGLLPRNPAQQRSRSASLRKPVQAQFHRGRLAPGRTHLPGHPSASTSRGDRADPPLPAPNGPTSPPGLLPCH